MQLVCYIACYDRVVRMNSECTSCSDADSSALMHITSVVNVIELRNVTIVILPHSIAEQASSWKIVHNKASNAAKNFHHVKIAPILFIPCSYRLKAFQLRHISLRLHLSTPYVIVGCPSTVISDLLPINVLVASEDLTTARLLRR